MSIQTIRESSVDWHIVGQKLKKIASDKALKWLNIGQRNSLYEISDKIKNNNIIIADEVGMGKTRIAATVIKETIKSGGRVALLIPQGLFFQWREELQTVGQDCSSELIRSLKGFYDNVPSNGWIRTELVLISHSFGTWKIGEKSRSFRISIFPEMYAQLRKKRDNRFPKGYTGICRKFKKYSVISETCIEYYSEKGLSEEIENLLNYEEIKWGKDILNGEKYARSGDLHNHFERAIGVALGAFDLIVIDEAHKSKLLKSGLSKILECVLLGKKNNRIIGMTATPVEIDKENWIQILKRIEAKDNEEQLRDTIDDFVNAINSVRDEMQLDPGVVNRFKTSSRKFQGLLGKYIIRRDKSEDESVRLFARLSGGSWHNYRHEKEIEVSLDDSKLSMQWKKAVLAAEALSFLKDRERDSGVKRIRLGLSSGHSLLELLDQESEKPLEVNQPSDTSSQIQLFWIDKVRKLLSGRVRQSAIYTHPGIFTTVRVVEDEYISKGRKVIIFGRFNRPLKEITALLNAREMLRRLDKNEFWPQYSIDKSSENVIEVAANQLSPELSRIWTVNDVRVALEKNEKLVEKERRAFRSKYLRQLENAIKHDRSSNNVGLGAMNEIILRESKSNPEHKKLLGRAIFDNLAFRSKSMNLALNEDEIYGQFRSLVNSLIDDDFENYSDEKEEVDIHLETFFSRLKDEFSGRIPRFAQFLYGDVKPHSRRMMQQAFNDPDSFHRVLVAQSQVGKEGLNLHKACDTVIMLHPEWNPGAGEQEIGRVDRVDSLWSKKIKDYKGGTSELPRIEFRPVIFKDTYDEYNWQVLRDRWDDLKAQLQGIIFSDRQLANFSESEKIVIMQEVHKSAPKFNPPEVFKLDEF